MKSAQELKAAGYVLKGTYSTWDKDKANYDAEYWFNQGYMDHYLRCISNGYQLWVR